MRSEDVPGAIVGRARELDLLRSVLDDAVDGAERRVAISGEAGIGKTRLLREIAAEAGERGFLVLEGSGAEFEREVPFAPLIDALDAELASIEGELIEHLSPERVAEFATIFPALERWRGEAPAGLQVERYRFYDAVRKVIEQLGAERPVLLALDDLHWADPSSIELVAHLLRRPAEGPVVLALAFRPTQAPPALERTIVAAESAGALLSLRIDPLERADAELLLPEWLDEDARRTIHEACGGNPFFLEELARAAPAAEATPGALSDGWTPESTVPRRVQVVISEEVDALDERPRDLLRAAALVGDPFDPGIAAEVAGLTDGEALAALDALISRGVIRALETPRSYTFRHPIVRRSVHESGGHAWRLGAHRRAADALAARGASVTARAHHIEQCAEPGDSEAVSCLRDAGEAVAHLAPASAARWFSAALRVLGGDADATARLDLLVPLAMSLGTSGQLAECRDALAKAVDLVPRKQGTDRAKLIGSVARLDNMLGRHGAADSIEQALDEVEDDPSEAVLRLDLCIDLYHRRRGAEMAVCARRALEKARAAQMPELEAEAATYLALAHQDLGDAERANSWLAEAEHLVGDLTDTELASRLECLSLLGWTNYNLQRWGRAVVHFERALVIARATGQAWFFVPLVTSLSSSKVALGRLTEALEDAEAGWEAARALGDDQSLRWAATFHCLAAATAGDLSTAEAAGVAAVDAANRSGSVLFGAYARCFVGQVHLERGEPDAAIEAILAGAGGAELPHLDAGSRPYFYALLAEAEVEAGRADAAENWVERAETTASAVRLPGRACDAKRARAGLMLARGDSPGAAELAVDAAEGYTRIEAMVDAGRAEAVAGRAFAAADDRDEAVIWLRRAHTTFVACGARRYRDRAARELRRLGARVGHRARTRRGASGLEALTPREREVAELVAEGRTNREIAAELFVSDKTVENQLSSVFRKLDVSSRSAVAGLVGRQGAQPAQAPR